MSASASATAPAAASASASQPSPSSELLARPAPASSLRVPAPHYLQDAHTPASSSSTTPNPSTCPSTTSTASSRSHLAKPDQTLQAQQAQCAPLSDLPLLHHRSGTDPLLLVLDPAAASPIVADWLESAAASVPLTDTPAVSPVLGPAPFSIHPSLATPRQQPAGLSTPEPPKPLAPQPTPSDRTIKATTIPVPIMSPSPTKPALSTADGAANRLQIPITNAASSRSPNPPPTTTLHATFALAAPSMSPSNSARASPVRSITSPHPPGNHMSKLGPTTKLDVGVKPAAEAQVKSPIHQERKSMFGKLFEKRNGDSSSKACVTDTSKSTVGGLAVNNSITPSTNDGSGTESETLSSVKKSMLGRKPSANNKKNSTEHSINGTVIGGPTVQTIENSGVMGILSRQASTSNHNSNGILNGGTSKLLSVNNHNNKATSDKSGGGEEKVVVSSSSKLRDMVGGKLGRKPSSSKPPRSDDGNRSEEIQHGDGKSKHGGGSQATSTLLKKYGVCEKAAIGKGATAVVRLAHKWDRGTDKLYAVKEFRKRRKNESEKEYVKKLTSEFCISSTLHHENIVETVDLVQDENQHWCEVMEYCPGGDLYAAIKRGSMSQADIHSYFKQMLLGVDYLHRMGVAHRDIKPENLLLDGKGKIKITDFGVSDVFRMCWEKTTHLSKGLCGSEPYLPKEMFERKEYDARLVDVWACAVVYYCCCIQELPWRVAKKNDPSFQIYLQAYESGSNAPPPISNLIRDSRSLIKKMWCPEPEDRIYIDEVLKDPWVLSLEVLPGLGVGGSTSNGNVAPVVQVVGGPSSLGGLNPSVVTPAVIA